ncbi:MAG: TVP38/TMEM64 family protein [Methylocystaceae bacterium]
MNFHDMESAVNFFKAWGSLGPMVAFGLFFVQAVIPVFPYLILAGAAGMVFGTWWGFILAWQAALWGAVLVFVLSKRWGKDWFLGRMYQRYDISLDQVDNRVWFVSIIIARVFPVVPTLVINVGAGMAGVSFWTFTLSSAIGKIPTALVYSALGSRLYQSRNLTETIVIIMGILVISFAGISYYRDRLKIFKRKPDDTKPNDSNQ